MKSIEKVSKIMIYCFVTIISVLILKKQKKNNYFCSNDGVCIINVPYFFFLILYLPKTAYDLRYSSQLLAISKTESGKNDCQR